MVERKQPFGEKPVSDSTPTKVLPTTPPTAATAQIGATPAPAGPPEPPARPPRPTKPEGPSRAPMIAFIVVAVLVFIALAILGTILIGRTGSPSASASNSASTTPTTAGAFTSFSAPSSATCGDHGAPSTLAVTWATTGAKQVWVARGSGDAASSGEQVPLAGNQSTFKTPLPIDCTGSADVFTMTLVGENGAHVSRTWSVTVVQAGNGKGHGHGGDGGDGNDNG